MTLPTIVALLLVVGFPLAFALYVSSHEYDLTEGGIGAFAGLENYARTLGDDLFANAARNTVILAVSVVALELIIALGSRLLLNQPGLRFRNVYLAILLIPLLVSPIAVGLIWRLLLHADLGAVNWALGSVRAAEARVVVRASHRHADYRRGRRLARDITDDRHHPRRADRIAARPDRSGCG